MLENLTAMDFLGALPIRKVADLYAYSLASQNVTVYHATFNDIMRRDEKSIIYQLIDKAFENGSKITCNSAIAEALVSTLKTDKIILAFSDPFIRYLESNQGTNNVVTPEFYEDLMATYRPGRVNRYAAALSVDEVARMTPKTYNLFYDYFVEEAKTNLMMDDIEQIQDYAIAQIFEMFNLRARDIAMNPNLKVVMNPVIRKRLRIDDLSEMIRLERAHRQAKPAENPEKDDEN